MQMQFYSQCPIWVIGTGGGLEAFHPEGGPVIALGAYSGRAARFSLLHIREPGTHKMLLTVTLGSCYENPPLMQPVSEISSRERHRGVADQGCASLDINLILGPESTRRRGAKVRLDSVTNANGGE